MYSEREIECGELKEALQQREHITVQQTPPPTPPPKPQVAAVPPPPPKPQATLVAQKKKTERSRYTAYMNALPTLPLLDRPTFDNTESALQPVAKLTHSSFTVFRTDLLRHRKMVHCPKRTIWCDATKTNALVIAPTHVISRSENRCVENQAMTRYCGQHVEFFAHKGHFVYYFGTYVVHSLRAVNPPGGEIPSDVSNNAIYAEMGLTEADVRNSSQFLPGGRVGTECFGMQCVGFDLELYRALKDRYRSEATTSEVALKNAEPRKRKAEVELRDENQVKAPRLA
ncbi:hypothetical protein FB45DRAFT_898198 [Roridomyces roridus]|uniref:Uncharacterized protein n=1 Tax=Roridomyces roridus TaxID=1738132 RepID=A0AAD7CBS3_9AGAR|nr:hypothetical protein FB45DRAFT_898198 [Roridomyces roridus]